MFKYPAASARDVKYPARQAMPFDAGSHSCRRFPGSEGEFIIEGGWQHDLPENMAESATADALRVICDYDLSELEALEPPRGFGRE